MKASVIREMTTQELKDKIELEVSTYDKTKMGHKISPIENPVSIRANRKDIARLKTELRNRELNKDN